MIPRLYWDVFHLPFKKHADTGYADFRGNLYDLFSLIWRASTIFLPLAVGMVGDAGLEPATSPLSGVCSTS